MTRRKEKITTKKATEDLVGFVMAFLNEPKDIETMRKYPHIYSPKIGKKEPQ